MPTTRCVRPSFSRGVGDTLEQLSVVLGGLPESDGAALVSH